LNPDEPPRVPFGPGRKLDVINFASFAVPRHRVPLSKIKLCEREGTHEMRGLVHAVTSGVGRRGAVTGGLIDVEKAGREVEEFGCELFDVGHRILPARLTPTRSPRTLIGASSWRIQTV
jgi:hypothetical protein